MFIPLKTKFIGLDIYNQYGTRQIGTAYINLYNVSSIERRVIDCNTIIEVTLYSDEGFYLNDTGYDLLKTELLELSNQ